MSSWNLIRVWMVITSIWMNGWVTLLILFPLLTGVRFICLPHVWSILKAFLPSLKTWTANKQLAEVACVYCTCMAGIGETCSHIAAVLFTVEANMNMKQQFSCTSLPCSWLPSSFQSVAFAEISKSDFQLQPASGYNLRKKLLNIRKVNLYQKRKKFLFLSLQKMI